MVEIVDDDTLHPSCEQEVDGDSGSSGERLDVGPVNAVEVEQMCDITGHFALSPGVSERGARAVGQGYRGHIRIVN